MYWFECISVHWRSTDYTADRYVRVDKYAGTQLDGI